MNAEDIVVEINPMHMGSQGLFVKSELNNVAISSVAMIMTSIQANNLILRKDKSLS